MEFLLHRQRNVDVYFTVSIMSRLNEIKEFKICFKQFNLEGLTDANIIPVWFK